MSDSIFFPSSSPYREPVSKLLQLLESAEIITPDNKEKAIAIAKTFLENNSDFISINWSAVDVLEVAKERNFQLSTEQTFEILEYLEHNHDANYGISWDTIHCAFDSLNFD